MRLLLATATLFAIGTPAAAQVEMSWASSSSGLYANAANWTPMNVPGDEPGVAEAARFNVNANLRIGLPDSAAAGPIRPHSVTIEAGGVTFQSPAGLAGSVLDIQTLLTISDGARLLTGDGVQVTGADLSIQAGASGDTHVQLLEHSLASFTSVEIGSSGEVTRDALMDIYNGASLSYGQLTVGGGAGGQSSLLYVDGGELNAAPGGSTSVAGAGRILNNGGSVAFGSMVEFGAGGERYREPLGSGAQRSFEPGAMITIGAGGTASFDAAAVELNDGQTLAIEPQGAITAAGGVLLGGESALRLTLDPGAAAPTPLAATGAVALDGALEIEFSGPAPAPGYSQTLVSAGGGFSGAFDQITTPQVDGVSWLVESFGGVLSLTAHTAMPGDYNSDGRVDVADFTVWRDAVGAGSPVGSYHEWRDHFGDTLASATAASATAASATAASATAASATPTSATPTAPAPEPAGLGLVGLAVFSCFCRRRR